VYAITNPNYYLLKIKQSFLNEYFITILKICRRFIDTSINVEMHFILKNILIKT